jgi:hypothetical protein
MEPLYRRAWLRRPVIAAFFATPVAVVARDLTLDWVRVLVSMEILAGVAIVVASRTVRPDANDEHTAATGWLSAFVAGFLVTSIASLVAIVAMGSSPSDIYDGIIVEALRVRRAMLVPFTIPPPALGLAVAGVVGAMFAPRALLRVELALYSGFARMIAGLVVWTTAAGLLSSPGWLALPLCWIAVVPPASAIETVSRRFLRVLLAALAVSEFLQVYPVSGSQIGIARLSLVAVGAFCLADAMASFRMWSTSRGERSAWWTHRTIGAAVAALLVSFGLASIVMPGFARSEDFGVRQALPFEGARRLRLSEQEVATYTGLVTLLHRYGCTSFIGYPNLNSLYLWSRIEAPEPFAPGGWITGLDDARQQRIVDGLRAAERPCAIQSKLRASFWLSGFDAEGHSGPLVRYIFKEMQVVDRAGDYWFMTPRADSAEGGSDRAATDRDSP